MTLRTAFLPVALVMLCAQYPAQQKRTSVANGPAAHKTAANDDSPRRTAFTFERKAVVTFSDVTRDLAPMLYVSEMPGERKKPFMPSFSSAMKTAGTQSATLPAITLGTSNYGNGFDGYVPNDNDIAISDSGYMMSAINCQLYMHDQVSGASSVKSFAAFTSTVNANHQEFDPKLLYDPGADRFIMACLTGFRDSTSHLVIGFSKTNNPTGQWNLYLLPGNPFNNNLWSDFPMISVTKKELFFTVNLLYEDSTWQAGFVETLIWQISKDSGYAGKNLATYLHSNIKYNNRPLRNICPVKGGSRSYGPGMYFLSNRNFAAQNDTVFLLRIADTLGAPSTTVTIKPLKASQPYYFPPDGLQPLLTQSLSTNDARNLGAFFENDRIQYVHNTANPANGRVSVYYGVIKSPAAANPTVTGYIVPNDTVDFAYPNISYAGLDSTDNTAIISFDHSSPKLFAGCSAIQADGEGNFSPILRIRNGTSYVDLFNDTINTERWGDYTGSQRRYAYPGEVWMSGFVGTVVGSYHAHRTWIAQLKTDASQTVGIRGENISRPGAVVFPNPANDVFRVSFELAKPEYLNFDLYDARGRHVGTLLREWAGGRDCVFSFRTNDLEPGAYVLKVTGNGGTSINKKIIIGN